MNQHTNAYGDDLGQAGLADALLENYNLLFRIAFSILLNDEDASDCVQDAAVEVLLKGQQLQDAEKVVGWLAAIVRNKAKDRLRRRKRGGTHVGGDVIDSLPSSDMNVMTDPAERHIVAKAVGRLPRGLQEVLVLRHSDGMATADIAAKLGITSNAARVRLHRAYAKLRSDESLLASLGFE